MTDREHALRWVNERRAARGEPSLTKLPKGKRGQSRACPLALALGCTIAPGIGAGLQAFVNEGGRASYSYVLLPAPVARFVRAFDRGLHPDLVAT